MDLLSAQIEMALLIVGAEDGSNYGQDGKVEFNGPFAYEIMRQHFPETETRVQFGLEGQPVQVNRSAGRLEVWCNGFHVEGSCVRSLVHRAARQFLGRSSAS